MALREWAWLRQRLAAVLRVTAARGDSLRGTTATGQEVLVEQAPGRVVPWLVLSVPICEQQEMDPERSLERNGTLGFSTIVLKSGAYWFRVALPFDSAELDEPAQLVALCAQAARTLSPAHVAAPSYAGDCFAHWTE